MEPLLAYRYMRLQPHKLWLGLPLSWRAALDEAVGEALRWSAYATEMVQGLVDGAGSVPLGDKLPYWIAIDLLCGHGEWFQTAVAPHLEVPFACVAHLNARGVCCGLCCLCCVVMRRVASCSVVLRCVAL